MGKQVEYIRSDAATENLKRHQRLRSRAKQFIWKRLQEDRPELFWKMLADFNELQSDDEKFEVKR